MNSNDHGLVAVIVGFIALRGQEKLDKLDKDIAKLKLSANPEDQNKLEIQEQKRRIEQEKFIPVNWLTDASNRAKQLQLVTHAPKFIHSDAKASGVYAIDEPALPGFVTTASLDKPAIDVVGNAAALDVGKLLQLSHNGKALVDYVTADDITPLQSLASNAEQAKQWLQGFKKAISVEQVCSHKLAKQVYWPMTNDGEQQYHLLAPLYATALQHDIYHTVNESRFSDIAKEARERRKNDQSSDTDLVSFSNMAEQHFGGTKPQNISQLNSQRYGKSYLLNAAPPRWETKFVAPNAIKSIFSGPFDNIARGHSWALREFIESIANALSTKPLRDQMGLRIDNIIELLFVYVAEIHSLDAGWSASNDCVLPIDEQLLLDPQRRHSDKAFEYEWDKKQWPSQIAAKFARWLNNQIEGQHIKGNGVAVGDIEFIEWETLLAQKLRILKDDFSYFYSETKEVNQ